MLSQWIISRQRDCVCCALATLIQCDIGRLTLTIQTGTEKVLERVSLVRQEAVTGDQLYNPDMSPVSQSIDSQSIVGQW